MLFNHNSYLQALTWVWAGHRLHPKPARSPTEGQATAVPNVLQGKASSLLLATLWYQMGQVKWRHYFLCLLPCTQ